MWNWIPSRENKEQIRKNSYEKIDGATKIEIRTPDSKRNKETIEIIDTWGAGKTRGKNTKERHYKGPPPDKLFNEPFSYLFSEMISQLIIK